jgi:type IV fimbrial biogenesis protein FimT
MKRSLPFGGLVAPTVGNEWQSAFSPFNLRGMKIRQSGFTLIELMIVVAIAAILLSLAAPTFREMLVKRSVQAAGETLASDMRFARSEALKRSARTVICQSADGAKCSAVVGSWSDGWIVYVDPAAVALAANTVVPAKDLVKVQQPLANIASIQSVVVANTLPTYSFGPTGHAVGVFSSVVITPTGSVPAGSTRLFCVSFSGRPALREQGASAC